MFFDEGTEDTGAAMPANDDTAVTEENAGGEAAPSETPVV